MPLEAKIQSSTSEVEVGQELDYKVDITSDATEDANATMLAIDLPTELSVKEILVDGKTDTGDIRAGLSLATIPANTTKEISVKTVPTSVPTPSSYRAEATVDYVEATVSLQKTALDDKTVEIKEAEPQLDMAIAPDKIAVVVGEEFTYTIELKNESTILAEDILLGLTKPAEFTVLETLVDEKIVAGDITAGTLEVGDLAPNASSTITVKNLATGVPVENPYKAVSTANYTEGEIALSKDVKDEIGVEVLAPSIKAVKSLDLTQVAIGDIVTFTITLNNSGTVDFTDVIVNDPIFGNLQFVEGSVKVDGMPLPSANVNTGVSVGPLAINQTKILTFEVEVIGNTDGKANNIAYVTYKYKLNDTSPEVSVMVDTNIVTLEIIDPQLSIIKLGSASANPLYLGDTITYKVGLRNDGDTNLENIIFQDFLPIGVKLNPDSITVTSSVAGTFVLSNPDLEAGLYLGELAPTESLILDYVVEVTGGSCSGLLVNEAFATYEYEFKGGRRRTAETEHVSTSHPVGVTNFSQLSADELCVVPCQKPDMEEINDIIVTAEILDSYVVETYKGTSNEGNVLSGYKLVVNGILRISIEYTADLETQPIHSYHCEISFGDFIILPEDYELGTEVNVSVQIEDIDANMISPREVYANIIYMLSGNICK